jgi:D-psicose/D-tagatose/L-ribulose 3-epimerase
MKIGINLLLWTGHVTDEHLALVERLKSVGFDGVEIPMFDLSDVDHYRDLGRKLSDIGLERTAVTVIPDPEHSPISADPAHRYAAGAYLNRAVDCAEALGATVLAGPYFQPLGVFSGAYPTEDERARCAEVHAGTAAYARSAGVVCALEPLNRFEAYLLNTCDQAIDHVRRVGAPGFGILYDTFHAHIEEQDPVAGLKALHAAGGLTHVHISENDRGVPGRGQARIRETIEALRELGYDDWLTIEAFGGSVPGLSAATRVWRDFFEDPFDVAADGYRYIKTCWENGHA